MYTYIDLTHTLNPSISVYPGVDYPPRIQNVYNVKDHGFKFSLIHMTTHSGTHIDAPSHFYQNGLSINQIQLKNLIGRGRIVDLTKSNEEILKQINEIDNLDFIILYSGWSQYWGTSKYQQKFPVITQQMANILITKNLKGVGTDSLSVDCVTTTTFDVHKILLGKNILILQNLTNLESLKNKEFQLYCFPLKIEGGDGSPARIVAKI